MTTLEWLEVTISMALKNISDAEVMMDRHPDQKASFKAMQRANERILEAAMKAKQKLIPTTRPTAK